MVLVCTLLAPVAKAGRPRGLKHKAPSLFVAGHRIKIEAELTQKQRRTREVRVYFRSDKADGYAFVRMARQLTTDCHRGILPAPGDDTTDLEYAIVVVAGNGGASRTKFRKVKGYKLDFVPTWQSDIPSGQLKVYTELEETPASIPGFRDDIDIQAVLEEQRYAVAAGLAKEKRPKGARKEGAGTRLAEREPGKKSKKAAGPLPGAEAIPWWRSISFERPEKKATKVKVTMNISHRAPKYFVARRRIMVEAAIVDKKYGVKEARLYFRAATEANFVFVPMAAGRSYHAVLPAPSENTEAIDYKILALNNNNVVYTSKDYVIKCKDDRRDGPRAPRDGSPS